MSNDGARMGTQPGVSTPGSSLVPEDDVHIVIEGVGVLYRSSQQSLNALDSIDLTVRRGEFVSIIGPSGCGKSTLLRVIGGLQAPTSGRVLIDGRLPREAQREKQVGFVFQDPSLLPWRNVIDNVRLPLLVNKRPERGTPGVLLPEPVEGRTPASSSKPPGEASPERLVDLVGLGEFRRYYPQQLSGGMQQRVAIARSLVTSPSLLLMDEPFGALDEITRAAMRYELLRVWRSAAAGRRPPDAASGPSGEQEGSPSSLDSRGCTVLFVTHSITEAVLLSDRVVVMTSQPGRTAGILDVGLPRPRPEEIEEDAAFLSHTRRLREMLREPSPA